MTHGARFFKCDLQLQTPADRPRWRGKRMGDNEKSINAAAEEFIRRCYEVGLEAIAITDHNFASKDFIPLLNKAVGRIANEFGYKLVIFPGFEIQADVGKGVHVLAIFDPDIDLDIVDHVLTECGVPIPRFEGGAPKPSTKRLTDILQAVQKKHGGRFQGLVICPHSQAEAGIFDNDRISEWLQAEEFTNPALLCVEVPKPVDQMNPRWQRLFRSGPECDEKWRRRRPIACIMSSDAKALHPQEAENYIGFRHSWIKLSSPTVEGLRQAFLAHESRIRLSEPKLPAKYIARAEVGACKFFVVRPLELGFSPQFNAIIGGRGTGKSTILEYIRWALCDQPVEVPREDQILSGELPQFALKRSLLINDTLKNQDPEYAYVRLHLVINETPHIITRYAANDRITRRIGNAEESEVTQSDIRRLMPIQAYSQKQLSTVAVRIEELRRLIESPIQEHVGKINQRIEAHAQAIRGLYAKSFLAKSLDESIRAGEAQVASLKARVDTLRSQITDLPPDDQKTLDEHGKYVAENQLVSRIEADIRQIDEAIQDARLRLSGLPRDSATPPDLPQGEIISRMVDIAVNLQNHVNLALGSMVDRIADARGEFTRERQEWAAGYHRHGEAFAAATERAAVHKVRLKQIDELSRQIGEFERQLDEMRVRREGIRIVPPEEENAIQTWIDLHRERWDLLHSACTVLTSQSGGDIRATLTRGGDAQNAFHTLSERLEGTHTRGDWLDALRVRVISAPNPAEEWIAVLKEFRELAELPNADANSAVLPACERLRKAGFTEGILRRVAGRFGMNDWLDVLLVSLEDRPEFSYRVADNQEIPFISASPGQQATGLLTVLIHQEGGPLIIDQPEEDLDNPNINRVVETIWSAKERRQIMFASHNANLVVNGDAEMVMHCEYTSAENRSAGRIASSGSIDQGEVCDAITNVMEGGEEAFELRRAKYGF